MNRIFVVVMDGLRLTKNKSEKESGTDHHGLAAMMGCLRMIAPDSM